MGPVRGSDDKMCEHGDDLTLTFLQGLWISAALQFVQTIPGGAILIALIALAVYHLSVLL